MNWSGALVVAVLGLTGSLCGCTRDEPTKRGDTSATSHRDTADATQHAVPDATPATTSTALACPSGGDLVFGCSIAASGKSATLCTTHGRRPVTTYRFGSAAGTELTVSDAGPESATTFHRTALMFAGATGGYVYSFRNAGTTYALYSISGNEGLARAGISVLDASGRKRAELACDPESLQETESLALIRRTRAWTPDPGAARAVQ